MTTSTMLQSRTLEYFFKLSKLSRCQDQVILCKFITRSCVTTSVKFHNFSFCKCTKATTQISASFGDTWTFSIRVKYFTCSENGPAL